MNMRRSPPRSALSPGRDGVPAPSVERTTLSPSSGRDGTADSRAAVAGRVGKDRDELATDGIPMPARRTKDVPSLGHAAGVLIRGRRRRPPSDRQESGREWQRGQQLEPSPHPQTPFVRFAPHQLSASRRAHDGGPRCRPDPGRQSGFPRSARGMLPPRPPTDSSTNAPTSRVLGGGRRVGAVGRVT